MCDEYEINSKLNIKLVQLVKQHPVLYNFTIEGGPNRLLQQTAWQEIANKLGEDGMKCKEKWKNIRSCYTRYLRNQTTDKSHHRKSYYLSSYMEFLQPFCKNGGLLNSTGCQDTLSSKNDSSDTEFTQDGSLRIESVHSEYNDLDEDDDKGELAKQLNIDYNKVDEEPQEERSLECKTAKRQWKHNKKRMICASERQYLNHRVLGKTTEAEADLNFLKSLLPEIRSMNNKQKNKFKISVLNVIQDILYSGE